MNKLKEKLNSGGKICGTVSHLGSGTAIECAGIAGLDFVVIDTEHGPFGYPEALEFIRAAEIAGMTAVVRVADYTRPSLHRMINCGAKAIIVPCIRKKEELDELVKEGRFSPKGNHCFPYSRNSRWSEDSMGRLKDFFADQNDDVLLIPQCETKEFLDNIETFVNIDGVDGIFLGPYDLSADMGIPGEFNNPIFLEARSRILKTCHEAGKVVIIYSPTIEAAKENLNDGFDGVAIGMDTMILKNTFKDLLNKIQQ